ncbi:endonuclease/exonuclease/phosphatase family protein [Trujillonella endophytica]|uniref:Metal-dependent hydrolase, endonuclease/exonuclease/phosphatase family n=1 Tax=Trujillonella endophytica TaxID=673521 RepID=A0A1H8W492_9ACTN|nr:endonuclease/exonuclease/phosphatase family protein [Trujillella endophytica]SEP22455.1 Metal-dependent hydrolase, endonuclease/exonuclease/phosphatase family [Trujillella endophytica]
MADRTVLRVGTLNLASGRGPAGTALPAERIAAALAALDVDVLAVQETDTAQPRSGCTDQPALVAAALGAADWRAAATVTGTPGPVRSWEPVDPPVLRGPGDAPPGPLYGLALVSRRPVAEWSVLALGGGRARLPVRAPDPRTGRERWWWIPDEPRVALAARVDGLTVVGTHLSFAPPTALRQLRRLRRWVATLPGPVVVAGDLNLPGALPARLLGGVPLVRAATFPAAAPRVQLDHLVAIGAEPAGEGSASLLAVGDHRALTAPVRG